MSIEGYYLGCPVWGRRDWVGELVRADAKPSDYLRQYAEVFNAVEGNTTFYAVPEREVVARWKEQTPEQFRFCFKLPKTITHERQLIATGDRLRNFLHVMAPLESRLGPFMIQLPPSFGPPALSDLARFLSELPDGFSFAVEVRNSGFTRGTPASRRLDDLLRGRGLGRIVFDTRALQLTKATDPETQEAQLRKPDLEVDFEPIVRSPIVRSPIVRWIGDIERTANDDLLGELAGNVAHMIDVGCAPYVFVHAPNDVHAPALARRLHERLCERVSVGALPTFPADEPGGRKPQQIRLF